MEKSTDEESFMYNNVLTYNKSFNINHQLDLVGGQEFISFKSKYLKTGATNFPDKNFGLNDMSLGASPDIVQTINQEERMLSYFFRANYNLKQRYLFAASIRADVHLNSEQTTNGAISLLPLLHGELPKRNLLNAGMYFLI